MGKNTKRSAGGRVKVDPRMVVAVLVVVALSAGTYLMFTKPMRTQAAAAAEQVAAARGEMERNNQRIADINSGSKSAADEVLVEAQRLDRQLPVSVDKVALVASIPNLAAQYGVTVNQMDPGSEASSGNSRSQAFTVSAAGAPESITNWISALQAYPSVVTVSGVSLSVGGDSATAAFTLTAHYVATPTLGGAAPTG